MLSSRFGPLLFAFVLTASLASSVWAASTRAAFTPQRRVGFSDGDQWEPTLAADGFGHVYVLYPQYGTVTGCATCHVPTMVLVISSDNGASWHSPFQIFPTTSGQFDAQIVVDPADRRTVYATWLQNGKRDVVLAKSTDFGRTWSLALASRSEEDVDKPVLAVRGPNIYVGFNHREKVWVSSSHDGGNRFTLAIVNPNSKLAWSLASGSTIDAAGNAYLSWVGYREIGAAKEQANLYVSKSSDGGQGWTSTLLDVSGSAPDCSAYRCGLAYLGAQITLASDAAGTLYALWNAGVTDESPERIYFSSSTTAGTTWSPKLDVSSAVSGVEHAFPAITASSAGDVRIAWMDNRNHPWWNTYYRNSTNGGATWSVEARLSTYARGYHYIQPEGFSFPFGDYFGIGIDSLGNTHAVWGEGLNFETPGSIWHASGR